MRLKRVLVIDEKSLVRAVCEEAMQAIGLEVETARSAGEALERLAVRRYDAVLLDGVLVRARFGLRCRRARARAVIPTPPT